LELDAKIDQNHLFNEVRITTIHSAKGLEAPIVFLADSSQSIQNIYGKPERIIWHENFPLWSAGENNNFIKQIRKDQREIAFKEYLRLLYVAMTRAADELYITGFGEKISDDCWYNIVRQQIASQAKIKNSDLGEILVIENEQEHGGNNLEEIPEETKSIDKIPDFLNCPALLEVPNEVVYPSKIQNYKNYQFQFDSSVNLGKIIHKILEVAVNIKAKNNDRKIILEKYLKNKFLLNQGQQDKVLTEVFNVLENEDFAQILKADFKTEVPIIGEIDGKIISGKIDLLINEKDQLTIIDYKSNLGNADRRELMMKYKIQLDLYKTILEKIYPRKKIRCGVMWTDEGGIEFLD
jgi:ATP-dependent helicase/nuclease subunit A